MREANTRSRFKCPLDLWHYSYDDYQRCSSFGKKRFVNFINQINRLYNDACIFRKRLSADFHNYRQLANDLYYVLKHFNLGKHFHFSDKFGRDFEVNYDVLYVPVELGTKWYLLALAHCGSKELEQNYLNAILIDANTLKPVRVVHEGDGWEWKRILWSLAKHCHALVPEGKAWADKLSTFVDMINSWNGSRELMNMMIKREVVYAIPATTSAYLGGAL